MRRTRAWRFAHWFHTLHACACLSFITCLTTFDAHSRLVCFFHVSPYHNSNAFSVLMRCSCNTVWSNFRSKNSTVSFPLNAQLRQALNARYNGKFASVLASTFAAPIAFRVLYAQSDHAAMADESIPCCNAFTTQVAACLNRKPSFTDVIQLVHAVEICKRLILSTTFCRTCWIRAVSSVKQAQRSKARAYRRSVIRNTTFCRTCWIRAVSSVKQVQRSKARAYRRSVIRDTTRCTICLVRVDAFARVLQQLIATQSNW